jgi:hypothetical protein
VTDEQIKHMVDRFLCWNLPETFRPDCGISFQRLHLQNGPIGTNLFTAVEAEVMVRHMLEGMPGAAPTAPPAPRDGLSQKIDEALEKSKPLVKEALRIGRSISGSDPSLAGVVIGSGASTASPEPAPLEKVKAWGAEFKAASVPRSAVAERAPKCLPGCRRAIPHDGPCLRDRDFIEAERAPHPLPEPHLHAFKICTSCGRYRDGCWLSHGSWTCPACKECPQCANPLPEPAPKKGNP